MFAEADRIDGGFADPVFDAQATFKAVMDAMARPGTIVPIQPLAAPPAPLSATAAAIALTLCDHDTPLWLDTRLAESAAVYSWLGFHTGAPLVGMPREAAFALVAISAGLPQLADFAQGTQEYPDRSTTIILQVDVLASDFEAVRGITPTHPSPQGGGEFFGMPAVHQTSKALGETAATASSSPLWGGVRGGGPGNSHFLLEGPGIQTTSTLLAAPLPANFVEQWEANRARFPRGVDLILAAPGALACLPRTVKIREG
jgi:alpha-D-ribose 1-methylphosphonate 5-triphosphate synthase subunit PhnH